MSGRLARECLALSAAAVGPQAKGTLEGFGGDFTVPSYRGSSFLDPKVLLP